MQTFVQGFRDLFPASENEVNQELQTQLLTIHELEQRVDQLTPVRASARCSGATWC